MKAQVRIVPAIASLVLASAALTACNQAGPAEKPAVAPAARVVGEPQSCIQIAQIQTTRIRDDWTIDFIGNGDRVWRNTLPNRCSGLKSEDRFTYATSLSQLCSTDIIYVLHDYGGRPERGAGCGLGQFVPVTLEGK